MSHDITDLKEEQNTIRNDISALKKDVSYLRVNQNIIKEDYILLKQEGINSENMMFDTKIAAYVLNATSNAYSLEEIARQYLELDITEYSGEKETKEIQTSLFDMAEDSNEEETTDNVTFNN